MKFTEFVGNLNPFKKQGVANIGFPSNPLADFAGLIAGRLLYPDINDKKYVNDYCNNSEVYHLFKDLLIKTDVATYFDKMKNGDGQAVRFLLHEYCIGGTQDMH